MLAIWRSINDLVWKDVTPRFQDIYSSALVYLKKWKHAQNYQFVSPPSLDGVKDGGTIRVKLHKDFIKVNVDAIVFDDKGCYGFGIVARDDGSMLIEERTCITSLVDPALAEAMAFRELSVG